jgi:uncharacterized membrane protein
MTPVSEREYMREPSEAPTEEMRVAPQVAHRPAWLTQPWWVWSLAFATLLHPGILGVVLALWLVVACLLGLVRWLDHHT